MKFATQTVKTPCTALACRCVIWLAAACMLTMSCGCGGGSGGGSNGNNNNPPPVDTSQPFLSRVSGTVTDGNGGPIINATVTISGYPAATTSQFGFFIIPNVTVAVGHTSLVTKISSAATVNGKAWSAQNTIEVIRGNAVTDNVNLSMSLTSTQGSISGTLTDSVTHKPLVSARVFAADGPYTNNMASGTSQFFTVESSYTAYTDANGNYTIAGLTPLANYTVTASFIGYINQTNSGIAVSAAANTAGVNFALAASNNSAALPTVSNLAASAITLPTVSTRAAANLSQQRGLQAIKLDLMQKHGLLKFTATDMSRAVLRYAGSRAAPAGYAVESILTWDYNQIDNLLGFDILRSVSAVNQFGSIALLRDPLGDRFADDDPILAPDTTYYYSVAMADTINFPQNGDEGNPFMPPAAVEPLGAEALTSPASGATVTGAPTFTWSAVNRSQTYTVMVYNQFPNYQSNTDPNAVQPIWSSSVSGTSQLYTGTGAAALVSGQTYYWAVIVQDSAGADFSISPIQSFVEH